MEMDTAMLKQKLHDYINTAEEKKLEAIYTILESEIENDNWWDDKGFVAELDSRTRELELGAISGVTWEAVKERAKRSIQEKKVKA